MFSVGIGFGRGATSQSLAIAARGWQPRFTTLPEPGDPREEAGGHNREDLHTIKLMVPPKAVLLLILVLAVTRTTAADSKPAPQPRDKAGVAYFEKHVRPLLIRRCYSCHSGQARPLRGELRLDTRAGWQRGGESGTAIRPGRPKASLLVKAVRYDDDSLQMPPKRKLPADEIRILEHWISLGAPDPRTGHKTSGSKRGTADHWAFRPLVAPPIPGATVDPGGWSQTPVDRFLLSRLRENQLAPSPSADRLTLIRRVSFDLLGLPPSPEEIETFLADRQPTAWQQLVDRLLASPHYGQRWGRHWLDIARYADSNGLDENVAHGNAWRYRDWVISAWNSGLPYDQFVRHQLAGDLLPDIPSPDRQRHRTQRLIATGFLSLGPKVLAEVDAKKMEMDIVDEQVNTVGRSFLGLTLGCARCHDHKFDPISMRDYYALAGVFQSTKTMEHFKKVARWWENPIATATEQQRLAKHKKQLAATKAEIDSVIKSARADLGKTPGSGETKTKDEESRFPAGTRDKLKSLRADLKTLETTMPELPTAMGVIDGKVADTQIHLRGNHLALGETVPRGVPEVLAGTDSRRFPAGQSGRLELANWLTASNHPLTARVFVNRLWRWHFGRGLVATTDNFGQLGDRPTHPHLLDFLATEFIRGNWSIKRLHRLIVLSSAYRMQSSPRADAMAVDPENRLWWRSPLRRLEAEALRDAMLSVTGSLDTSMRGSLLHVKNRGYFFDHTSKDETRYNVPRRSVYLPVVRNHLYDVFTLFDYTDASVMTGHRATTTVAPQALFLLNSKLVHRVSRQLAGVALDAPAANVSQRLDRLYRRILGRPATSTDLDHARRFLDRVQATLPQGKSTPINTWTALCHVLVASNEFIYLK